MPKGQKPYLKESKVPFYPKKGISRSVAGTAPEVRRDAVKRSDIGPAKNPDPVRNRKEYIDKKVDDMSK